MTDQRRVVARVLSLAHDHLIDMKTGQVVEFVDEEIEALQTAIAKRLGYRLVDHRLELYGVPLDESEN